MQLTYPTVAFELLVVAAVLLLAFARPATSARLLHGAERRLDILPTSLGMQLLVVGLFAVALRAAFLPWLGPPIPMVHDENSLLLQAQTYLEGRLAMPRHELWPHFQTFHVNASPTFSSIYFPGRGLPLVPGLLLDEPWLGVWLSFVLLAMGTVWMLRGWTAPRVALVGGILVVLRLGAGSYWINSYWGGAFTAFGAMLVVGAMPRIIKRPRWSYGLLLGLGALILMTTRPFEGAVLCAALGLIFLPRLMSAGAARIRKVALSGGLPLVACIAVGMAGTLAYNDATTGNPRVTTYELNRSYYAEAPAFLFAAPPKRAPLAAPAPAHFARFYADEAEPYLAARQSLGSLAGVMVTKLYYFWVFYIGPAMSIPFLVGLWQSRRDMPVVGTLVILTGGYLVTTWPLPHYVAPVLPLVLILVMRGLVALGRWSWRGKAAGYVFSRGSLLAAAAPLLVLASHLTTGRPGLNSNSWDQPCCAIAQTSPRLEVLARLDATPGRDLVLVTSNAVSRIHGELVWNEPDIDAAPVIFAHSFDSASDRRLTGYYPDRRLWRFEWLEEGYRLEPLAR